MKKLGPAEKTRYDCSINYISKTVKKYLGGFTDKTVSFLKQHI